METISWRAADFRQLHFQFYNTTGALGRLQVAGDFSVNADFASGSDLIRYVNTGFWESRVVIMKNGNSIGQIRSDVFGSTSLSFDGGSRFRLSSNIFGRNVKWIDDHGQAVVTYRMPTLRSQGRGFAEGSDSLTPREKEVLIPGGLITARFILRRFATTAVFALILMNSIVQILNFIF